MNSLCSGFGGCGLTTLGSIKGKRDTICLSRFKLIHSLRISQQMDERAVDLCRLGTKVKTNQFTRNEANVNVTREKLLYKLHKRIFNLVGNAASAIFNEV